MNLLDSNSILMVWKAVTSSLSSYNPVSNSVLLPSEGFVYYLLAGGGGGAIWSSEENFLLNHLHSRKFEITWKRISFFAGKRLGRVQPKAPLNLSLLWSFFFFSLLPIYLFFWNFHNEYLTIVWFLIWQVPVVNITSI